MSSANRYFIPAQSVEVSTVIKRSQFIAFIAHCPGTQQAEDIITQVKQRYPDARHHCWAYIAGPPYSASAVRFSDDGEPSGTAGKPILNVLQHSHYGEIICVVSRYFGGIKLGAGGLVRAYSNSTQSALEQLSVKEVIQQVALHIQFPYCYEASIRHYLDSCAMQPDTVDYQEQVIFSLGLEQSAMEKTIQKLQNICKGELNILKSLA